MINLLSGFRMGASGFLAAAFLASGVEAQGVQWPEKRARAVDAAALFQTASKLRAKLGEENSALGPAHGPDANCIEQLMNATGADLDEIRQTYRLAIVDLYMVNPVDEDAANSMLFDALAEGKYTLQKTHAIVQVAQAFCSKSTIVLNFSIDVEALEGEYGRTISTLQERIGPRRPGLPTPTP